MRDLQHLNRWREMKPPHGWAGDETCGMFWIPSPVDSSPMRILASQGEGWDHVSVSRKNRLPNWKEMDHIYRMFFKEDEVAIHFHVPEKQKVNFMPTCLHLWRCQSETPKLPPIELV